MNEGSPEADDRQLQILTTEHYVLHMAYAAAISEAGSRTGQFIATLSAVVIATGLLISSLPRNIAALIGAGLLVVVYFIGLVTFLRVVETSFHGLRCQVGINRIRHRFGDLVPEVRALFVMSTHDDLPGVLRNVAFGRSNALVTFVRAAGMISTVNSVVAAAAVTLIGVAAKARPAIAIAPAVLVGACSLIGSHVYQHRIWLKVNADLKPLFPSESA